MIITALLAAACCANGGKWEHSDTYVDAFRFSDETVPTISFDGDSVYTIKDWYGVPGYDIQFVLQTMDDSTMIDIIGVDDYRNGFYFVETGLPEAPVAGISPGLFEPNHTLLSGFYGDGKAGRVWSYVYLYDQNNKWIGGHYYILHWGEPPMAPIWTVEGESVLPGDPAGKHSTLAAFPDGHYTIYDWYGVEKYNLDFAVNEDGGIRMLDYYAEENGGVFVQARRSDIGDPLIPQDRANGGLELDENTSNGAPVHGRLHFSVIMYGVDEQPMADEQEQEFIFEW